MRISPGALSRLMIASAIATMAISAWLIVSIVVMAGMRGAFGSHPAGEQLRIWQYINCAIVVGLQVVATLLIAGRSRSIRQMLDVSSDVPGFSSIGQNAWQRYAVSFIASVGVTLLLTLLYAAIRD